jgi:hypothetical protein
VKPKTNSVGTAPAAPLLLVEAVTKETERSGISVASVASRVNSPVSAEVEMEKLNVPASVN